MKRTAHQSRGTSELLSGDGFLSQDSPRGDSESRVLRNVTEQELFEALSREERTSQGERDRARIEVKRSHPEAMA